MTLRCLICWQPILPDERHVVFDGGRGQGEHLACLSSTADVQVPPESHKLGAPGATPGSAPSCRQSGGPILRAAARDAAGSPILPAGSPPVGRGARGLAPTICTLRSEDTRDGRGVQVPSDGSGS